MYQNYVFDLYGTLLDVRTAEDSWPVYKKLAQFYACRGAKYQPEELRAAYHRLFDERYQERMGSIDERTGERVIAPEVDTVPIYKQLFTQKGVEITQEEARATANWHRIIGVRKLKVYPGVFELFRILKAKGKGIYLLSNAQREYTYGELVLTGLLSWFDGIVLSSDYGCCKPDPILFRELTAQFGLNLKQALMIGNDRRSDIGGANAVGMDSLLLATTASLAAPIEGVESTFEVADGDFRKIATVLGLK